MDLLDQDIKTSRVDFRQETTFSKVSSESAQVLPSPFLHLWMPISFSGSKTTDLLLTSLSPTLLSDQLPNQFALHATKSTVSVMSVLPVAQLDRIPSLSKTEVLLAESVLPNSTSSSTLIKTDALALQATNSSMETVLQLSPTVWTSPTISLLQDSANQAAKSLRSLTVPKSQPPSPLPKSKDQVRTLPPPSPQSLTKDQQ